jgi:hypothetical protein
MAREYVTPDEADLKWNNPSVRDASAKFVAAGGRYGLLDGAEGKDFTPQVPAFEPFHARVVYPVGVPCVASAGKLPDGRPIEYNRMLADETDRRYLIARTDRAVIIGSGNLRGADFHAPVTAPVDRSCAADLVPKVIATRARALAMHIPASMLDDEDARVDFTKESLVVFARPKQNGRATQPEFAITIALPRDGSCPGGRPPDKDTHYTSPAPTVLAPASIELSSLETGYIIPKGRTPIVHRLMTPAPRCSPMP